MENSFSILLIERSADERARYREVLERDPEHRFHVHEAGTAKEGLEIASRIPHQARFSIRFDSGKPLQRNALFFNTGRHQSSDVAQRLGCDTYEVKGCIVDHLTQMTHVSGLYVVGDASRDVLLVSVAIAEGTKAAIAINTALRLEDVG